MSKSIKEFCSLYKYIEKKDKKLCEIINDTCTHYLFNVKGNRSLTFLYPNSTMITKMKKEVDENGGKEVVSMLKQLLLNKLITTKEDLTGDISNKQGNKLDDPSKIKFSLRKDAKFFNENISILDFDDSTPPAASTPFDFKKSSSKKIKGGTENISKRFNLTKKMVQFGPNAFRNNLNSLISYIENQGYTDTLNALAYVANENPVAMWFVSVQPLVSSPEHEYIIPENTFNDWCNENEDNMNSYTGDDMIEELFKMVKRPENYFKTIKPLRNKLLNESQSPSELPEDLQNNYIKFYNSDNVDFLPSKLKELYKADPMLKLLQDEVYFYCSLMDPVEDFTEVIDWLNTIEWNKPKKSLKITRKLTDSEIANKNVFFSSIATFVVSVSFLNIPLSVSDHETIADLVEKQKSRKSGGGNSSPVSGGIFYGGVNHRSKNIKKSKSKSKKSKK